MFLFSANVEQFCRGCIRSYECLRKFHKRRLCFVTADVAMLVRIMINSGLLQHKMSQQVVFAVHFFIVFNV